MPQRVTVVTRWQLCLVIVGLCLDGLVVSIYVYIYSSVLFSV